MRLSACLVLAALLIGACTLSAPGTESSVTTTNVATTNSSTPSPGPSAVSSTTIPTTTTEPEAEYDVSVQGGTEEHPEISVAGPDRFSVGIGDKVSIKILSAISEELHLHGYDLFFDLVAGTITEVAFTADVPGIFEAELEGSHTLVFEIEVSP